MTARFPLVGLVIAAAVAVPIASGCGNACQDLQALCDRCLDPNQKLSCESAVDRDEQDVCEQNADYFDDVCK